MLTNEQIENQIALERNQISGGIEQFRSNTRALEAKNYASASAYGVTFIEHLLPVVVETLDATRARITSGTNGPMFAEVAHYLNGVESPVIAAIGLKILFDHVFSPDKNKHRVTEITASIGSAIEAECQMRYFESEEPQLLKNIQTRYWHKSIGTKQKQRVASILMGRRDVEWATWGREMRVKLGCWVADKITEASGWFMRHTVSINGKKSLLLVPTPEFLEQRNATMLRAEDYVAFAWPMIVPPADWSPEEHGGYLLNSVSHRHSLIRRIRGGEPCMPENTPYAFINNLQKVTYRLNPFVVEVAEVLFERRIQVGKFHPVLVLPLPPKPLDIAENYDSRKSYRREAAEVMNRNAQQVRASCRTRATMAMIERFKGVDRFWLPWSFDYRGRVYPIPAFLTPQDTDFGKSLLRFADEAELTDEAEFWLAFQVATAYGLDKATISDRHEWVSLNNDLITRVATDPINNLSDWCDVEEPWQFLAACDEFYHCCILRDRTTTGLPVAIDATCSGLQILAGLARDKSTATLVNVVPGDKPQDAYKAVAEVAKTYLPDNLAALLDRKVTKRTVMTIPYNAKPFSNRQYIRAALKDKGAEFDKDQLNQITKAVIKAMHEVVPGPMAVMQWVNDEVTNLLKSGTEEIRWTTPSGFTVTQRLMKPNLVMVQLKLLGRCKLIVADGESEDVDRTRHKAATAPNLIHSLDASLLHLAFADFGLPFTVIHDSVLCRATDMAVLNQQVRDTYTTLFSETDFLSSFADQIGATNPPPIIGDFDPSDVKDSTYFFS